MLFDLRGRGRRRTVQVIYASLAILMGGGLVLFGIGSSQSGGGLFDAFGGSNSGGGGTSIESRVKDAEDALKENPRNAPKWAELTRLRYQAATSGDGYDQNTGAFTDSGKQDLAGVKNAWDRYLALDPARPDPNVALLMVQALGAGGLSDASGAVAAMEIVIDGRGEEPGLYLQYAQLAYLAKQDRKGDLAADKAVSLSPQAQRKTVREQLDQIKAQIAQQAAQDAQSAATATTPAG